jgi:hypothetical protein
MSAAPAYIVYGHRHSVRILSRLIAIGLLLAAIATVFFGIVWQRGDDPATPPATKAGSHGGAAVVQQQTTTSTKTDKAVVTPPAVKHEAKPPPAKPKKLHRPAKPIPPNGKIPIMVLNSNGIKGAAHRLAATVQSYGYPIAFVGNAQKHGLPTIVQYAKGYGPAARKLARRLGNVQFVTPFDGITPSQAGKAKLVIILGT